MQWFGAGGWGGGGLSLSTLHRDICNVYFPLDGVSCLLNQK